MGMRGAWLAIVALACAAAAGCATVERNAPLVTQTVLPMASGEAADVSAEDLARAMVRAGFTRDQVLRHGPALRNALASAGSAQVRDGREVGALFAVHGGKLYVTSRSRGTFIQRLDDGEPVVAEPEAQPEL